MKKIILMSFLFGLLVLSAGCAKEAVAPTIENKSSSSAADQVLTTSYSLEDVAKHASAADCWLVIHDQVYNVSKFVSSHPGGQAILSGCGRDATQLYETRPMGSKTPHSERARNFLPNYYIGELAK